MKKYPAYIGGIFTETDSVLEVFNPFNQEKIAETFLCGKKELEKAILAAEKTKEILKNTPAFEKSKILKEIALAIEAQKNELATLLCLESAKPIRYAIAEIERAAQTFFVAAEECKRIPKEYISLDWTKAGEGRKGLVEHFPVGIVAGISPFNFPMNLAVHKIAPALAAGCPIILKPASSTPLSVLELAKIIDQTTLPKGAFSVVPMKREEGNHLINDNRINLISFTGSPEIGWEMKKNSRKKKIVLELGGNAGVIISKNTDLTSCIQKCMVGAFAYSGQICIHAQRFFVHESLFEKFVSEMKKQCERLIRGNPLSPSTEISNLIDEQNAMRIERWVNEAITLGAELICGGKREGSFYEPTLLTQTHNKMKVYAEEVFGPVSCIEKFSTIEEAVNKVNDSRFGLQCGLFSDSNSEIEYCMNNLEVGGIILNDAPTLRLDHMPYGGVKDSGLGREGVKYAIQEFMEPRILVK